MASPKARASGESDFCRSVSHCFKTSRPPTVPRPAASSAPSSTQSNAALRLSRRRFSASTLEVGSPPARSASRKRAARFLEPEPARGGDGRGGAVRRQRQLQALRGVGQHGRQLALVRRRQA